MPLQRIAIPLSRLPTELERVRQGVLVEMPRSEFEALLERAARAGNPAHGAARLTRAKYSAELVDNFLVRGRAQWTIHQTESAPGVLPIPSFNLAVSKVLWTGGKDALLGNLNGKSLGLFVDKAGEVILDWSLRGMAVPGGFQFDLQLPPCPLATLELTLPADHHILIPKNVVLLAAPEIAEDPGKRIWHLQFSGRSEIILEVRRSAEPQQIAPLLLALLQTSQRITPERLLADFDFQVEIVHTSIRELVFDCDPSLQPYDVSIQNADLKSWKFKEAPRGERDAALEGDKSQQSATLVVQLREPFQGNLQGLKIRCLAPFPGDKPWTSPTLRLRQTRLRGEILKVSIHPDVHLQAWDSGGFRLVNSAMESGGSQVLSLVDPAGGLEPARRPGGQFKSQGVELITRQWNWWQIGPKESVLAAEISYELVRGSLYQLAVKLPVPNGLWRVDTVELEPKDALRSWATTGSLLLVDLQRGLNPRNPVKLLVRLTLRPQATQRGPQTHAFPVLEPLNSSASQGTFAISVDPLYQAALEQASAPLAAPPGEGPWLDEDASAPRPLPPQYFFRYRDHTVTGRLRVFPQKEHVRSREDIVLAPGRGIMQRRLASEPMPGKLPSLNVDGEWCDQSQLVTYVQPADHLLHHFRFHAWNWRRRELMVVLPVETKKVLAAKVDGCWVERLDQEKIDDGWQIKLPAAMDREGHCFELYYLTPAIWSGWPDWADLQVPPPRLPMASPSFRRIWRLAPGLAPLYQEHLQPLSDLAGFGQDPRRVWHLGDPVLAEVFPFFADDSFELQRQVLLGAESGLRRKLTPDMTLGEALDRLTHEFLKEQLPMVVDRAALRAAGLRPDASLAPLFGLPVGTARPFWEAVGLVYVPFSGGPVLTTREQQEAWQAHLRSGRAEVRDRWDAAVAEAIAHTTMPIRMGRFVTLGHWLRTENQAERPPAALFLPVNEGWTLWEPRPGREDAANLVVVQSASLSSLGILLGLLSLGLVWCIGKLCSLAWCFRLWVILAARPWFDHGLVAGGIAAGPLVVSRSGRRLVWCVAISLSPCFTQAAQP